jgi:CubicO group peptidase (beta-lactamase class C family)/D-alanyl-D-alanine dipeptidase
LSRFIETEMMNKGLPALSIVLVDDQEIVWARGFGMADPELEVPATANTVYRVGSVSKLFTDIAVMQLVERDEIDLDAPVARYLSEFAPENPYDKGITLRQLMSHRAGLVREPPVGNYFDPNEPTLAETVASLNQTALVYEPEEQTKYSNAGIAVVGYVLERTKNKPFAEVLRDEILLPLRMESSGFAPSPRIDQALAKAYMWTYDGRQFEAPRFELGMAPAGCMYSTVGDLGRFMKAIFRGGEGMLEEETLESMFEPQYAEDGAGEGYGLGFAVAQHKGRRLIRHGGAIYGFATELAFLPDEKLGVVAITTMDGANTAVSRFVQAALESMLAVRGGSDPSEAKTTSPVESDLAARAEGLYRSAEGETLELVERGGRLWMWRGGFRLEVRALGEIWVVDDLLDYGSEIGFGEGRILLGGKDFEPVIDVKPEPAPERWRGLIGEYGWDHNTLYILEKEGKLHALIEWFFLYPLEEISEDVFAFPDHGLYEGEKLMFKRDDKAVATEVVAAGVEFARRPVGLDEGTFRIQPVRPVSELRELAASAEPPVEEGEFRDPELVDLAMLDPTIKLDIRYASTNNFMGASFYTQARAFLQRPAAEAVLAAHRSLKKKGYGLLIHDAYRPWLVTKMFWDGTPESQKIFVADPSSGSRHNRGSAVDLTLYDLKTGKPVRMVGGYDEFSTRAYPEYPGGTSLERWHRELLRREMEAQGFTIYEFEWWHFDHRDWNQYPILNLEFEALQ